MVSRTTLVSTFLSTTFVLETTAPTWSVTTPLTEEEELCAEARVVRFAIAARKSAARTARRIGVRRRGVAKVIRMIVLLDARELDFWIDSANPIKARKRLSRKLSLI